MLIKAAISEGFGPIRFNRKGGRTLRQAVIDNEFIVFPRSQHCKTHERGDDDTAKIFSSYLGSGSPASDN